MVPRTVAIVATRSATQSEVRKPEDDPAQVVAAELVGAEEMPPFGRRGLDDVLEVELVEAVRRDLFRKDRHHRREDQHHQARDRELVTEEADPRVRPLAPRLDLEARLVGELDVARAAPPAAPAGVNGSGTRADRSVKADAWVEPTVGEVGDEVEDDDEHRSHHEERHHGIRVAGIELRDEVEAHPVEREDRLGDDRAGEKGAEVQRDQGDEGESARSGTRGSS